jgi:hypothetical protein
MSAHLNPSTMSSCTPYLAQHSSEACFYRIDGLDSPQWTVYGVLGAPVHPILMLLRTPVRLLFLLKSARTSLHLDDNAQFDSTQPNRSPSIHFYN